MKNTKRLIVLKTRLDKQVKPKKIFDERLREQFWLEFVYESSEVEEVELTKKEIKDLIENGSKSTLLQGNPRKALLQAFGQLKALELIEEWTKFSLPVEVDFLGQMHKVVFEGVDSGAGTFRKGYIRLKSSKLMPSFPFAISADIRDFNKWLLWKQVGLTTKNLDGILDLVTRSYHSITKIHPFEDGNGRTGRLFINLILRRYELPYVLVPKVEKFQEMRQALRSADMGNFVHLDKMFNSLLAQSLRKVINYWEKRLGKFG